MLRTSRRTRQPQCVVLSVLVLAGMASPAVAQNWSFDARRIALGGVGDTENVASKLVDEQRRYGSIVIPIGMIQLLQNSDIFDPGHDAYDPVRAMEFAASPIHYTFGREKGGGPGGRFVNDIVNAQFSRDLNRYRGFRPATELVAEGLASPNWGKTFMVRGTREDAFHGIYVGAGPYFSIRTDARIDQRLIDLLGAATDTYIPNTTFQISNTTADQLALAIIGGYRARLALPGRPTADSRSGVYIAANYNYLRGFHYDDFDLRVRFDTDSAGLITLRPTTTPVVVDRLTAQSGTGFALDFGGAVVIDRWDFGFGASGVANRIEWKEVERERWQVQSLIGGGEFEEVALPGLIERRVELPVSYSANAAYHADTWSALSEYAHGFQGNTFHGGLEYRFARVELRGGARYSLEQWNPSGGAGFNLTPRFGIDVAAFGTSANIERRRNLALAISFRLNR